MDTVKRNSFNSRPFVGGLLLILPALVPWSAASHALGHTSVSSLGQGAGYSAFDPDHQKPVAAEKRGIRVVFKAHDRCASCPSGYRLHFEIFDSTRATRKKFVIENRMAQVDAIHVLSPSKTVILGRVQASIQIVTVVHNETAIVTDSFLGFRPVVSPSGQFVAYVKVFPIHFVEGVSNKYLIYDFERTPVENRGPGIPITNDIDVGFAIFPLGSSNLPGDNLSVVENDRHMLASERFFWSADSKNLAFVDWSNGQASIVVAEISPGSRIPRIASKPLDPQEISNSEHCKEYRDKLAFSFVVTQIEFLNLEGSHVRLKFRFNDPGCKRLDSIDLSLP